VSNKTVAFVLYPGLTPLDLIGPLQVMSGLEAVEEAMGSPDRHHVVVVAERLDAFPTDTPVRIAASTTLHDIPGRMSSSFLVAAPRRFANWRIQYSSTICGRSTATPKSWPPCAQARCCSPEPASCKVAPPPLTGHIVDSLTGWERGTSQNAGSRMAAI
jgi:hypothetical protein